MSLVVPPETAVVTAFFLGTCSSLLTALRHRARIDWVEVRRLSLGAIVAMPLGVVVLVTASASVLRLVLGLVTCAAAIWMLLPRTKRRRPIEVRPAVTYGVGAVSGVLNRPCRPTARRSSSTCRLAGSTSRPFAPASPRCLP